MKLLFDQNISPVLVKLLADLFPGSMHVSLVGLDRASDAEVWEYARLNEYLVVTKDADFADLSVVRGFPPKVIWLRLGNCTTQEIEGALRRNYASVLALSADRSAGILTLG